MEYFYREMYILVGNLGSVPPENGHLVKKFLASSLNHVGRRSSFGGFTWSGGHDSLLCESQFSLLIGGLAS